MKRYLAELIGTFMLVFFGTGAIIVNELYQDILTPIGIALSFGLTLMVVIYTPWGYFWSTSEPSVSLGFWFTKRFPQKELVRYVIAQCVGALLASTFLRVLFPSSLTLGTNSPSVPLIQAFVLEFFFTLVLMFTILNVSTTDCKLCPKTASPMVGITVGVTLTIMSLISNY